MIGSIPFIQTSGLNNNVKNYMRITNIQRSVRKNIYNQSIPGTNNSPNNEIDFIGTNNRQWNITGDIPLRSGTYIPESYGLLASNELSISGISVLEVTGSPVWFYDGIMTIKANMSEGTLNVTTSGAWVEVASVDIGRSNNYVDSSSEVGYIANFKMTLVETKI